MVIVKISCYVCLEGFEGDAVVTKCGHLGHLACVKKWVDHAHNCFECGRGLCAYEYSSVGTGFAAYRAPEVTTFPNRIPCLAGLHLEDFQDIDYAASVVSDLVGKPVAHVVVLGRNERSVPGSVEVSEEGAVARVAAINASPFARTKRISVSFGVRVA